MVIYSFNRHIDVRSSSIRNRVDVCILRVRRIPNDLIVVDIVLEELVEEKDLAGLLVSDRHLLRQRQFSLNQNNGLNETSEVLEEVEHAIWPLLLQVLIL